MTLLQALAAPTREVICLSMRCWSGPVVPEEYKK